MFGLEAGFVVSRGVEWSAFGACALREPAEPSASQTVRVPLRHMRRLALLAGTGLASACPMAAPAFAADVELTSTASGVNLDTYSGSTVHVGTGVTIQGAGAASNAISATTRAWTLSNDGTIAAAALGGSRAIRFTTGGTINNSATISATNGNTIELPGGGTVNNLASGTISAAGSSTSVFISGALGTVSNAGTIVAPINITAGGSVTNDSGATISATANGSVAVTVRGGTTGRTITNSGTIKSTGTGFATGVEIGTGTGTGAIVNQAGGSIFGTYNGVYAGASVVLDLTNRGQITSTAGSAVESAGGGTYVNTGTIASTNSNGMLIRNNSNADVTNSGTIGGAVNAISFADTGGTAIAAVHTLRLQTGSVLNGNVLGGANTDNLILNGTGTESIAKFLNFETLSMLGTDWALTNTGTFSTSATVQSGTLRVNGALTSPLVTVQNSGTLQVNGTLTSSSVTVQSGGALVSNGMVTGPVTINNGGTLSGTGAITGTVAMAGTIAPGASIGTLTINGNYTQAAGSVYNVEVNTAPASDLIKVNGNATIAGGTVNVLAAPGTYLIGQRYTILTASGGVTGHYAALTDNSPFVDFALSYDPNTVYLSVDRSTVAFGAVAETPNQRAAASGLQSLLPGHPVFDAAVLLSAPDARRAFDALSGEIHATLGGVLIEDSRFIREAVTGRLMQAAGGPAAMLASRMATLAYAATDKAPRAAPAEPVYATWAMGFGNWGRVAGDGNAASSRRTNGGVIGGFDAALGPVWRAGFAGGYQHSAVSADARASSGGIDTAQVAAYAGGRHGPVGVRLGAAYAFSDIDASRSVVFPGFADALNTRTKARTVQVFGDIGYRFDAAPFAVEPFAALAYVNALIDGFTERGGAAALTSNGSRFDDTFSTLGLRTAMALPWLGMDTALRASAGWRHVFGGVTPLATLALATSTPFTVAGVPIDRDAAALEFGLDMQLARATTLSVAYNGQIAKNAQDHGLRVSILQRF